MKDRAAWWKGARGEWYVVVQGLILALIALGPRTAFGLPEWPPALTTVSTSAAWILLALGAGASIVAVLHLGPNLTPLPHPKDEATLVESGLYGVVRHPIYCALILMAFGWALFVQGWLTLAYAALLFVFFDIKSRREEAWLMARFPDYAAYRQRVRKLIPFLY
ncbi:MAG: isoprenylcysteine carboxylmethyltransferase family protein [Azoarcus sp.]|nr:isoprenylcysteine carboxylmethyltransferase family protein [Azoarcus sp.]